MTAREPAEIAVVAVETGMKKATRSAPHVLVSAFLAGAYIAFGGLVAIAVSSGLDPKTWGTLPTLFTGSAFALGLVLVIIAGSDLATGNMMLVPISALRRRIGGRAVVINLLLVLLGNLIGAAFVAYFLADQAAVIGHAGTTGAGGLMYDRLASIAQGKVTHTPWQTFLRGVGCNWLVCLAVWMSLAAPHGLREDPGDLLPDHGVRRDGLRPRRGEHVLPAGRHLRRRPRLNWGNTLENWLLAGVGNLVGAVLFVSVAYWYLFLKDTADTPVGWPETAVAGTAESAERA